MPSFSIPLTGLQADSVALTTIGNNLANLNTTAYKEQTARFSDLFYDSIGSAGSKDPLQVGVGTRVSSIATDFTEGTVATASDSSDMAINGNGFFLVEKDGTTQLTRAGNFTLDATGDLVTSDGDPVQGYPAVNGVLNTGATLATINIPTASIQLASATTKFSTTTTLDASSIVGTQFTSSSVMYDSLGGQHTVDVNFAKTGLNTWSYNVALPAGDAAAASGNTGTLTFNSDGTLATPATDVTGINFTGLTDGASNLSLTWNLRDANMNSLVTQTAATSTSSATTQNGYPSGTYKSFSVDSTGVVTALFSNGNNEVVGQVALATVANEQGLTRSGDNLYAANQTSGAIDLGVPGAGGRGVIVDSSLEQSNIDISTEFANLIVAQRAFEANSKTVTTFDTVTQDTISLIR